MVVLKMMQVYVTNFFSDSQGNIVIAQWPNVPLWGSIVFALVSYIPIPYSEQISFWGVLTSLTYWAYLEIRFGDSRFRQVLGLVVLVMQLRKLWLMNG